MRDRDADVVIVCCGIGGGALATYSDRVRGESLLPWGVREARSLGVEADLLAAGAHICPTFVNYAVAVPMEAAEQNAIPLAELVPGTGAIHKFENLAPHARLSADSLLDQQRA